MPYARTGMPFSPGKVIPAFVFLSIANAQWNAATNVTSASLRGIHNAGKGVIWASGANGTVLRSEDDGFVWQQCAVPPGAEKLDFRGVFGWNENHAVVMSIGTGAASRLYETTDGCTSWHLLFENPDPKGFWDAVVFHGNTSILVGDPVDGRFVLYRSDDLGQHWHRDKSPGLAASPAGEGLFAASNSSLAILPGSEMWMGTGGIGGPRIFQFSPSSGWSVQKIPLAGGKESAGVFSIAFRDAKHGIAVGGDYKVPAQSTGTAAWTSDGGASWHAAKSFPSGYRSSVAWDPALQIWIAVGTNGSDLSRDDGQTWKRFDSGNWNALSLPWVVGPKGQIASLDTASPSITKETGDYRASKKTEHR
jgi:photosystem II stability/assembly factor-like uncharacterized protein